MSTRLMTIKMFCYGVIYFLCQVTWCDCEVTWVTRNVTDSFRIDQDGCLRNKRVCTLHQASCQDDGSCLCNVNNPNFRNPTFVIKNGDVSYGSSYGCITDNVIAISNLLLGKGGCRFKPFQVIPNDQATKFVLKDRAFDFESCFFRSLEAKYINNKTRSMVPSVDKTYVHLKTPERSTLYFQWRKSVLKLQGLIIRVNLECTTNDESFYECLQAKVLGTWRSSSAVKPTNAVFTTKSSNSDLTSTSTKKIAWTTTSSSYTEFSSTLIKITPSNVLHRNWTTISSKADLYTTTSSTTSSSKSNQSESSCTVIIAILVSIIVFLLIVILVFGFRFLKNRRKRVKEHRTNSEEMQSRTSPNVPDVTYEEPPQDYEPLHGNRQNEEAEHVYQGLVGASKKDISAYERPSSQDYAELDGKRRNSEHTYQRLIRASER